MDRKRIRRALAAAQPLEIDIGRDKARPIYDPNNPDHELVRAWAMGEGKVTGKLTGNSKARDGRMWFEAVIDQTACVVWVDGTDWKMPIGATYVEVQGTLDV